jgi:hypothetical protein
MYPDKVRHLVKQREIIRGKLNRIQQYVESFEETQDKGNKS